MRSEHLDRPLSMTPERLLAAWVETGRPADLPAHLERYGPPPLRQYAGRTGPRLLLAAVEEAGLTGRGGAGFPTARKMRAVMDRRGVSVVLANGSESEPASVKDAMLLSVAPHLVLDGAAVAAGALGSRQIHLCISEGRLGLARDLRSALLDRRRAGLEPVPVELRVVPHRYVAGEESALVHWLSGGEAKPIFTPPRPADRGVRGRPTLVNNVETLAHLGLIARYGPAWFRSAGHPDAPGTTLVTISGAVARPGVYEVELGTTLEDALVRAGGPSESVQALLLGGYFGTWLPLAAAARLPLTRTGLAGAGASLGAGVVVALPERACGLAETARVLGYLASESAGQCGPCVFGLPAVADDFAKIAAGMAVRASVARLRKRLDLLPGRGACRMPDGAAQLAASALRTFADEVAAHERGKPGHAVRADVLPVPAWTKTERSWR